MEQKQEEMIRGYIYIYIYSLGVQEEMIRGYIYSLGVHPRE